MINKYQPGKCLICGVKNAMIWTCEDCTIPEEAEYAPDYIPAEQYSTWIAEKIKKIRRDSDT